MKHFFTAIFLLTLFQAFAQTPNYRDSIDVLHYHIKLDLSDLKSSNIKAETTLQLSPKSGNLQSIALDLQGLQVDKVLIGKKEQKFTHKNNVLQIALQKPLKQGKKLQLTVFYHGKPEEDKQWGGFFITQGYAFNYGIGMEAKPPNFGRVWYPCIDNFTDRATYEYSIKIKKGNMAACPGLLTEVIPQEDGTEIWHWKLRESIPTYLSSVAVSDYKAIKDTVHGLKNVIPIEIYVKKEQYEEGKKSFVHVKNFLHAFENAFGPYVWEKIGYASTPFAGGAMEHATNIAYSAGCNGSLRCENTLAHELSHHWFGNLVTCSSEKDMWLNEGWASYSESIFREYFYGKEDFKKYNRNRHKNVLQFAHVYDLKYRPLYAPPHEFTYGYTIYEKGADVAHALRGYLGDSLFFSALKQYFIDYAFKNISVPEFRDYMSNQTGVDLNNFFDFWVFGKGFPHFSIKKYSIAGNNGQYETTVLVNQRLKEAEIYLNTPLEIALVDSNWRINTYRFNFSGKTDTFNIKTDYQPLMIMIDPEEKIPDATVDEYRYIKRSGQHSFRTELCFLDIEMIRDSAFMHVTHHWIKPLSNPEDDKKFVFAERYWTINFLSKKNYPVSGGFLFDFSYVLDKSLRAYGYDRLRLLYRKNPQADWEVIDSKVNDKKEIKFLFAENIKPGEYAIGIVKQ